MISLCEVSVIDLKIFSNWFGTTSASPDNASSKLGSLEQSTPISLDSFDVIHDSEIEEGDDFELINFPDEKEKNFSLNSDEVGESVAEIAGFNREKLLEMCTFSKMTYGNNDTKLSEAGYKTKAEFIEEGYDIIPFYSKNESYSESKRLAGFVFTKGKEVSIAYRGTKDIYDVMADANIILATSKELLPEGGRMHSGFYGKFQDSWSSLYKILATHANEQKVKIKDLKINITGHSMGGAIAKIAALCLNKKEGAEDVHVATFGDPRVFDLTASEVYNNVLQEKTIRVTQHRQDPVPASVPGSFGYAHVGAQLRIETPHTHTVHKIDGYYQAINKMEEKDFKSNNNVSLFYYPVRVLNQVNCMLLGNAQHYAANLRKYLLNEPDFFEEVKSKHQNASWFEQVKIEQVSSTYDSFLHITRCV